MIQVLHIITGLSVGGAETMLTKLLSAVDRQQFQMDVISLSSLGPMAPSVEATGSRVRALGMRPGAPSPAKLSELRNWIRSTRPDVVQTWMYHADLFGGLAARMAGVPAVAWNLRQTSLSGRTLKRSTRAIARASALLSRQIPTRIISCSEAGAAAHAAFGYDPARMVVIPNGFDLSAFHPDPEARDWLRAELNVAPDCALIGFVARRDPHKDHRGFIEAARLLCKTYPETHFVLCGKGMDGSDPEVAGWLEADGMSSRFHLLGRRSDIDRVTAGFDIACVISLSEGFANVLGEAMACGVPCVATDVGDSALVLGDTGAIVPSGDPRAVAAAWGHLLSLKPAERALLGERARARVEANFSLPLIARRYEAFYKELVR